MRSEVLSLPIRSKPRLGIDIESSSTANIVPFDVSKARDALAMFGCESSDDSQMTHEIVVVLRSNSFERTSASPVYPSKRILVG